jgi:hypothetical protein
VVDGEFLGTMTPTLGGNMQASFEERITFLAVLSTVLKRHSSRISLPEVDVSWPFLSITLLLCLIRVLLLDLL